MSAAAATSPSRDSSVGHGLPDLAAYACLCPLPGEDHQEDYPQADLQRVQGRPPEADQAREALRDLRQEAQDQGPDVLDIILIVQSLVNLLQSNTISLRTRPAPLASPTLQSLERTETVLGGRERAPSPTPSPPASLFFWRRCLSGSWRPRHRRHRRRMSASTAGSAGLCERGRRGGAECLVRQCQSARP